MSQIPPTGIRIPEELKDALKREAERNHRSMHAEILHRLERSLMPSSPLEQAAREARDKLNEALGD